MLSTLWTSLVIFAVQCTGVSAIDSDIIGTTVAASVSFFLLVVVITMLVVSFSWYKWYNNWMANRGKVRMPREYFRKKEEMRRRLLSASASPSMKSARSSYSRPGVQSSTMFTPNVTSVPQHNVDKASWVEGWNQSNGDRGVETLHATMVLDDEKDEEFRIETVLVDNEVLDVGPYKTNHYDEKPVKGDVYKDPYIYTSADKIVNGDPPSRTSGGIVSMMSEGGASRVVATSAGVVSASSPSGLGGDMVEVGDYSTVGEMETKIDSGMIKL